MNRFSNTTRRGFTLIELLVTMALIILLLSIAIAVANSATLDSYKIVGAGDKLSQTLITAKSRAARDKAPRGVRLIVDPASGLARELIYIEQPEPWIPDQSQSYPQLVTSPAVRSYLAVRYPQNGSPGNIFPKPNPANCEAFMVLTPDDELRFTSVFVAGQTHIATSPDITAAFAFTNTTGATLENVPAGYTVRKLVISSIINPDLAAGQTPTATMNRGTFKTSLFGIYLPAKPLAGEPSLILSKNISVDFTASLPYYTAAFPANVDILFSPQGHVMYRNDGVIAFLLRDTTKYAPIGPTTAGKTWLDDTAGGPPSIGVQNFRRTGEMTIVAVYPKTGTVFTKPVAEPSGLNPDPFAFCRDAISNSGL